ncbi:MAG: hypothetical protein HDR94_02400 [Bacteroides sp.]|nr:hypothetical protein [Bacteroides sp.]
MYKKKKGTDSSDGFAVNTTAPITPLATPDNLSSNSAGKVTNSTSEKQEAGAEGSLGERISESFGMHLEGVLSLETLGKIESKLYGWLQCLGTPGDE